MCGIQSPVVIGREVNIIYFSKLPLAKIPFFSRYFLITEPGSFPCFYYLTSEFEVCTSTVLNVLSQISAETRVFGVITTKQRGVHL